LLSGTSAFRIQYGLVAEDVAGYGEPSRLLDIGTGPGRLLVSMRRVLPGTELVAVDISEAMVARARRTARALGGGPGIRVERADAASLPFPDGCFDRVVSTGSLHHWRHPAACLAEVGRVLSEGGVALIYELVRRMPREVRMEVTKRFGPMRSALLRLHSFEEPFPDAGEMLALGRDAGFADVSTRYVGALCCLVLGKRER